MEHKDSAVVFPFNHNGITLSCEELEKLNGAYKITEPRLLNGAQTVTTFAIFLRENPELESSEENKQDKLMNLRVLCKIITKATQEFITTVTINNNRQNPVEPWNLHANDLIQLDLHDKFASDLGIYYERQENAFANLSDEDLDDLGISEYKAIQLLPLAKTFLISDGDIAKLSQIRQVFEEDRLYDQVFNTSRLKPDSRKIVLCYKIQFRLRRLIDDIIDKGPNKYDYVKRARNLLWALLCQGVLNDSSVDQYTEYWGSNLMLEVNYTDWLAKIATTRCRFLILDLVEDEIYREKVEQQNYSFLRTNAAFTRCMEFAYKKHRWTHQRLK